MQTIDNIGIIENNNAVNAARTQGEHMSCNAVSNLQLDNNDNAVFCKIKSEQI